MREMIVSELIQAVQELARGFARFLPRLIVMLIIAVVGWVIAYIAKIIVRREQVRVGIERSTKHRDSVARPAAFGHRFTEVAICFGVVRVYREGLFVIGQSFIEPGRAIEEEAAVIISEIIVVRYGQSMIEKGEGIFPNTELTPSAHHTGRQHRDGRKSENWPGALREERK